ncbi:MAG: MerR family transcriptional regulator [Planctomycetota bacterium]
MGEELFKTSELVKRSGLSRQVIYEYITFGLIKEEKKTEAGHRLFSDKTLKQIKIIKQLVEHGYSLRGVREVFIEGKARQNVSDEQQESENTD